MRQIRDGYVTLHEIGAVNDRNELTPIGRRLRGCRLIRASGG